MQNLIGYQQYQSILFVLIYSKLFIRHPFDKKYNTAVVEFSFYVTFHESPAPIISIALFKIHFPASVRRLVTHKTLAQKNNPPLRLPIRNVHIYRFTLSAGATIGHFVGFLLPT